MKTSEDTFKKLRNENQLQISLRRKTARRVPMHSSVDNREAGYRLIVENLPSLWNNYDQIMNTPELYFSEVDGAYISVAFIGFNDPNLYLGDLLTLWKYGHWTQICEVCGHTKYIFGAAGSPLSGSGGGWGVCAGCDSTEIVKQGRFFDKYPKPMREFCTKCIPENCNPFAIEKVIEMISSVAVKK